MLPKLTFLNRPNILNDQDMTYKISYNHFDIV